MTMQISLVGSFKRMMFPVLGLGLLAGCSAFEPDQVACPNIKALEDYEYVMTKGDTLGQDVTIRVNGVDTACYETEEGHRMEIGLGLMLKRPADDIQKIEKVGVDVTFAFLDSNDDVVGREIRFDDVFIGSFKNKSRPVLLFDIDIPADTRVVFGLGRAVN